MTSHKHITNTNTNTNTNNETLKNSEYIEFFQTYLTYLKNTNKPKVFKILPPFLKTHLDQFKIINNLNIPEDFEYYLLHISRAFPSNEYFRYFTLFDFSTIFLPFKRKTLQIELEQCCRENAYCYRHYDIYNCKDLWDDYIIPDNHPIYKYKKSSVNVKMAFYLYMIFDKNDDWEGNGYEIETNSFKSIKYIRINKLTSDICAIKYNDFTKTNIKSYESIYNNLKVDNFITYDKCSKDKRMIVSNIGRLMWCNMILTREYSNFFTADIYIMNTNYVCISTFTNLIKILYFCSLNNTYNKQCCSLL